MTDKAAPRACTTDELATQLGCTPESWQAIKSAGRQGVRRAFKEGGIRKAKIKLAKMMKASAAKPTEAAVVAKKSKKRRRREAERLRQEENTLGRLTRYQVYVLYAVHHFDRLYASYGGDRKGSVGAVQGRERANSRELTRCRTEFKDHLLLGRTAENPIAEKSTVTQFVSAVRQVMVGGVPAAHVEELQRIVRSYGPRGLQVASLDTPITAENLGYRLLKKLGWAEGTGLGAAGQGAKEPIRIISRGGAAGVGSGRAKRRRHATREGQQGQQGQQ